MTKNMTTINVTINFSFHELAIEIFKQAENEELGLFEILQEANEYFKKHSNICGMDIIGQFFIDRATKIFKRAAAEELTLSEFLQEVTEEEENPEEINCHVPNEALSSETMSKKRKITYYNDANEFEYINDEEMS